MSFPQSTPEITRWCALLIAVVLMFPAMAATISLVEAERTGIVDYSTDPQLLPIKKVTRVGSPEEFNQAVMFLGFHIALNGTISVVSFWFYRRLSQ